MCDVCTDNRFEIIAKAKQALLDSTNIDTSPDEMACLNNFLFRCWQMGWLDEYDNTKDVVEVLRCKYCDSWNEDENILGGMCDEWSDYEDGLIRYTKPDDYCSYGEKKEK